MSFLDKAKAKAAELAGTVKDKVDDFKEGRKVEELLEDLGRITYRQRTDGADPKDAEAIEALITELKRHAAEGAVIVKPTEPEPVVEATVDATVDASLAPPTGDGTPMPPPPPSAP
jgi:hypothetical protein